MLKIERTIIIKSTTSNSIIAEFKDVNNLLKLERPYSSNDYTLEVYTVFELKNIINKIHKILFNNELANDEPLFRTNGILPKNHQLYQEENILDLVKAEPKNSEFDI